MFPKFGQPTDLTCCHSKILQQLDANPAHYCAQKFTSWQVNDAEYFRVLAKCRKWSLSQGKSRRVVVWTTFREPVSMFLSLVHQMCNKNLNKRTPAKLKACLHCDYDVMTHVWEWYVETVTRQIHGSYRVSHLQTDAVAKGVNAATLYNISHVVTLEPNDLNAFWDGYTNHTNATLPRSNPEKLWHCSFRPSTELVKALGPAVNVYRKLVAGG